VLPRGVFQSCCWCSTAEVRMIHLGHVRSDLG
jgi:hypothetical protein